MSGLRQPGRNRENVNISGTVTLTPHDLGKTFWVTDTAVITLPTPGLCPNGGDILFINYSDTDLTVGLNELTVTKNNLAADSVAYSTSSEKIGGAFWAHTNGVKWAVLPLAEETQTISVTTD